MALIDGLVFAEDDQPGAHYNASKDTDTIQRELVDWLFVKSEGAVQSGPFKGMKILPDTAWKACTLAPVLLGCYEEELHDVLEHQIARLRDLPDPKIAVIGCAEGYYAVGMKLRLPHATVYAVDSDQKAIDICACAAKANSVELAFRVPIAEVMEADFIFMDCEGSEVEYLNFESLPTLKDKMICVEIHNYHEQKTGTILFERFSNTHDIYFVLEGARNPNKYDLLCNMMSQYRWMAVCEDRPCCMMWFVMLPKGSYDKA